MKVVKVVEMEGSGEKTILSLASTLSFLLLFVSFASAHHIWRYFWDDDFFKN